MDEGLRVVVQSLLIVFVDADPNFWKVRMMTMSSRSASVPSSPYYPSWSFVPFSVLALSYTFVQHAWIALSQQVSRILPVRLRQQHEVDSIVPLLPLPLPTTTTTTTTTVERSRFQNHVAIVTGSNTGIGYETAKSLVLDYGMTVILACRSRDKAEHAAQVINQQRRQRRRRTIGDDDTLVGGGGQALFLHPLDLSSFDSVKSFAAQVKQRYSKIHILVNNAGRNTSGESEHLIPIKTGRNHNNNNRHEHDKEFNDSSNNNSRGEDQASVERFDLLFKTNFLGHFLLTAELMSVLRGRNKDDNNKNNNNVKEQKQQQQNQQEEEKEEVARIINLSSVMHHYCGGYNLENVEFWRNCAIYQKDPYVNTYSVSKLASILFTIELNRRFFDDNKESSSSSSSSLSSSSSNGRRRHHHLKRIRSLAVNPGAV